MIIIAKEAERELEEARLYLNQQAMNLGDRFLDDVEHALGAIDTMPLSFPKLEIFSPLSPYRRALLRTFRYSIIFELLEERLILVVAVAHTSRKPHYWLGRTTT